MPNRFSTQAANADVMSEDAGAAEGMKHAIGADGTPRDRSYRTPEPERKGGAAKAGEGKAAEPKEDAATPAKDIHAAGSDKDKDAAKP